MAFIPLRNHSNGSTLLTGFGEQAGSLQVALLVQLLSFPYEKTLTCASPPPPPRMHPYQWASPGYSYSVRPAVTAPISLPPSLNQRQSRVRGWGQKGQRTVSEPVWSLSGRRLLSSQIPDLPIQINRRRKLGSRSDGRRTVGLRLKDWRRKPRRAFRPGGRRSKISSKLLK